MSIVFLGIFDNDEQRSLGNLKREEEAIGKALTQLRATKQLIYYTNHNLGIEGVINLITDYREIINWFHFSGHHDIGKGVKLNDGNFKEIGKLLFECPNLKGVFINGCTSTETLSFLENKVPICIGTVQPVYDGVAMKFSELFYNELRSHENWNDYDEIHSIFHRTNTSVFNLLKYF